MRVTGRNQVRAGMNSPKKPPGGIPLRAWPPGWRAVIGFITPVALPGSLFEYETIFPEGVGIISVPLSLKETTAEGLKTLSNEALAEAPKLRLADVISYNCTSGAALKGIEHDREVITGIEKATGKKATSMATACVEALRALGAKRVIMVSPYVRDLVEAEKKYFADQGFHIVYEEALGISNPIDIFSRLPSQNYKYALSVYKNAKEKGISADALFIACGAMQAVEVLESIEKMTGIPAISSKTANAWMCLKLAEIHEPIPGFGKLLELRR